MPSAALQRHMERGFFNLVKGFLGRDAPNRDKVINFFSFKMIINKYAPGAIAGT